MRRLAVVLLALLFLETALSPLSAGAVGVTHVTGGGTATISQFGLGVVLASDGSASGHFECLMAGRSAVPGLALMAVQGEVATGSVNADGSVTLLGFSRVTMNPAGGPGQILTGVPFRVTLAAGGAGIGMLKLTLTTLGMALPLETVTAGRITIQ